ncbi:MAG: hypothetical protein LBU70_05750 [Chitinispirillales bacterium]|nr:hypothetical protein [Chitinispirillales bacterium]
MKFWVFILLAAAFWPISANSGGREFWIVEIIIEGPPDNPHDIPNDILPKIPALHDENVIQRTALALSRFYSENGYPYNKIHVSTASESDSSVVSLRFLIDPDERVRHGPAIVAGGVRRAHIYMNDIRIPTGRLYNSADIDETIRRLSMRQYVRHAYAAPPVIIEDAPLCGDGLRTVAVPVVIDENRGMAVEGAIGYQSGSAGNNGALSGRIDLSFINMLGHGETAEASYAGADAMQRLRLSASRPWAFGLPLEMGGALGLEIEGDDEAGYGFFNGEFWAALEINARLRVGAALKTSETVWAGNAAPVSPETANPDGRYVFYGADVFMSLIQKTPERGQTAWEFSGRTGSGVANRERTYSRHNMELTVGAHLPVLGNYAVHGRAHAMSLFTDEERLTPAELYRIGGHGSLRGYFEDEFAFRSTMYLQAEMLYYFNQTGAVFIFIDGGAGFDGHERLSLSSAADMLGYGAGIRFPSRMGMLSVEWARNIGDERWSLGRVHVAVKM